MGKLFKITQLVLTLFILLVVATLLFITPLFSYSLRSLSSSLSTNYPIYLVINVLIITLGVDAGLLSISPLFYSKKELLNDHNYHEMTHGVSERSMDDNGNDEKVMIPSKMPRASIFFIGNEEDECSSLSLIGASGAKGQITTVSSECPAFSGKKDDECSSLLSTGASGPKGTSIFFIGNEEEECNPLSLIGASGAKGLITTVSSEYPVFSGKKDDECSSPLSIEAPGPKRTLTVTSNGYPAFCEKREDECKEIEIEIEEEEVDHEEEGASEEELFVKAEVFICNFYKQLKMQREESWNKIHHGVSSNEETLLVH